MKKPMLACVFLAVFSGTVAHSQEEQVAVVEGHYLGQKPPGMVPRRFAPGFISTEGYDLTPTFSPALDEVFFGRRPTEDGSDNRIFYSRMVNGRWQTPVQASFS